MYPSVEIYINKIIENIEKIKKIDKENRSITLVTKVLAGNYDIVNIVCNKADIKCIADSQIINLKLYNDINVKKWLIKEPGISEIIEVVKYADISFNSELEIVKRLNEEAKKQNKIHGVILTYELGDIREGCNKEELYKLLEETLKFENIKVYGIASNLSCFGGVIPSNDNMTELSDLAIEIEKNFNIKLEYVTALNTSAIPILKEGNLPKNLNNIRMGEAAFCGYNTAFSEKIEEFNRDTFILKAEIVEIKEKASVPRGTCLVDFSGNKPYFKDKGIRKRALINIGNEDINVNEIFPKDNQIEVVGGCSNYTILDITDCNNQYKIGDIIEFEMSYFSILKAMKSKYVEKEIYE